MTTAQILALFVPIAGLALGSFAYWLNAHQR